MAKSVLSTKDLLQSFGFWYTLHRLGVSFDTLWTIFVAHQSNKFDNKKYFRV
jgi:hypothetical protein